MKSEYVDTNGIRLHYLDYGGPGTTLVLMHGLTANAHAFEGLIRAGLSPALRVISVDLRGRGLSDHPGAGYTMAHHAQDIIGLLDKLGIEKAIIGGHSFGALLSLYLAAHHPHRVAKMVLIDGAAQMHPNTIEMLASGMSRLGKTFPSFDAYQEKAKEAPFVTIWDPAMAPYYRADVIDNADGTVTPRSQYANMSEAISKALEEPWENWIKNITQPAILFNATEAYTMGAPLLPKENALATAALMQHCTYQEVRGNHLTMLYDLGAKEMARAILNFLQAS